LPALPPGTEATRFKVGAEELAVLSIPLRRPRLPRDLTPAERQVLLLLMKGRTNDEIARARGTALRTVANQVQAIFKKLGVSSRNELVTHLSGKRAR
jgi:DNA-binding CsgD family transcriptional regulator